MQQEGVAGAPQGVAAGAEAVKGEGAARGLTGRERGVVLLAAIMMFGAFWLGFQLGYDLGVQDGMGLVPMRRVPGIEVEVPRPLPREDKGVLRV